MITGATIGFYLLAIVAILASLRVITRTNPVHALLNMIVTLLALSGYHGNKLRLYHCASYAITRWRRLEHRYFVLFCDGRVGGLCGDVRWLGISQ